MKRIIIKLLFLIINIAVAKCKEDDELYTYINKYVGINKIEFNCENATDIMECTENNEIITVKLNIRKKVKLAIDEFPIFPKLKLLSIHGDIFDGEFPYRILERLPNLKILELFNSKIEKIPPKIINQDSLEEINLNNNTIKEFPYQFKEYKNLKKLHLNHNKINEITSDILFDKIDEIDLSYNEINEFSPDAFDNLKYLKKINLSSNKITELPYSIFNLPLKEIDISNNKQLNAQIINFSSKLEKCNFENTNIECYQKNTCLNIENNKDIKYPECSPDVIQEIKNGTKFSKKLSKIIIAVVILFGISGFLWMYKSNKKRKNAREADIIISPTVKTSNYYNEMFNKKNDNDQNEKNNENNLNNTQGSFERILPESLTSSTSPTNQDQALPERLQSSINNIQDSSTTNSQNNYSPINNQNQVIKNSVLSGNTSIISNQIVNNQSFSDNTPNIASPFISANTSGINMLSPAMSPISTGNTSILNITSPLLQQQQPLNSPNVAYVINNNNNVNNNNNMLTDSLSLKLLNNGNNVALNNNNLIINNNNNNNNNNNINASFISGQINGQTISILPVTIRPNNINNINNYNNDYNNYNNMNMAGSSSSSSDTKNKNVFINDYGLSVDDVDDIKLKKKILQEKELSEKYNLLNNNNPDDQDDKDNNLPPYSTIQ